MNSIQPNVVINLHTDSVLNLWPHNLAKMCLYCHLLVLLILLCLEKKVQSLLKLVNDNDDSGHDVSIKKLAGEIVKEIKTVDCDKT